MDITTLENGLWQAVCSVRGDSRVGIVEGGEADDCS